MTFKFDLSQFDEISPRELGMQLNHQLIQAGDDPDAHIAHMKMGLHILCTELAYAMVVGNDGQWNQEVFSNLGTEMKEKVQGALDQFNRLHELVKENPRLAEILKDAAGKGKL